MRDVADVRAPDERQRVMLAERGEGYGALDDLVHLTGRATLALGRERGEELRVALITVGRVVERANETLGRVDRAGRVEVHAHSGEYLGGVSLEALPLLVREVAMFSEMGRPYVVVLFRKGQMERGLGREICHIAHCRQGSAVHVSGQIGLLVCDYL